MIQHVAIPLDRPPHLHRGAELPRVVVAGMAARHDRRVGLDRCQRQRAIFEHHLPAAAHDLAPVPRLQMGLQQPGVGRHLRFAVQRHSIEMTAVGNLQPVPLQPGVGQCAGERARHRAFPHCALGDLIGALDHRDDRQAELQREGEVAVVVRRHGHDRAGAVRHQHVVGDPDRDARAVDRVDGVRAGEDAGLLALGRAALDIGLATGLELIGSARPRDACRASACRPAYAPAPAP